MQGKVAGLIGDLAPVEATFALKQLIEGLGEVNAAPTTPACRSATAVAGTATIEDIDNAKFSS